MTTYTLMSYSRMVREARSLLPSTNDIEGDETLKLLSAAAEKSVSALYSYLNDKVDEGTREFKKELDENDSEAIRYEGNCGACDPLCIHATIHNCGL